MTAQMEIYALVPADPAQQDVSAWGKKVSAGSIEPAILVEIPPYASLVAAGTQHDDGLQDVVFVLAEENATPVPFTVDTLAEDLTEQVADIAETFFISYGKTGLERLWLGFRGFRDQRPGRGDGFYRDKVSTPRRHRLITAVEKYWNALPERVATARKRVEEIAAAEALRRLAANAEALAAETAKYYTLDAPGSFLAQASSYIPFRGTDVDGLVADLLSIAAARTPLTAAEQHLEKLVSDASNEVLDQYRHHYPVIRETNVVRALEHIPERKEVAAGQANVDALRQQFAALITQLGSGRPILYRLVNTDLPEQVSEYMASRGRGGSKSPAAAIVDFIPLRIAVGGILGTAAQANQELSQRLSDPQLCWKFDRLIDTSLRAAGLDVGTFAARVALDRLAEEHGETALTTVSSTLGNLALFGAVLGLEPLAAGLTAAQLLLDVINVVVKAFELRDKQLGATAFLNPAEALDIDQSWAGVGVSAFFVLLGLATSGSSVKSLVGR
jgi:hypothetical protein